LHGKGSIILEKKCLSASDIIIKIILDQHKGKRKGRDTCCSASYMSTWPEAIYNLGSGSWLAWANDIPQRTIAAIHCPRQRTLTRPHAPTQARWLLLGSAGSQLATSRSRIQRLNYWARSHHNIYPQQWLHYAPRVESTLYLEELGHKIAF